MQGWSACGEQHEETALRSAGWQSWQVTWRAWLQLHVSFSSHRVATIAFNQGARDVAMALHQIRWCSFEAQRCWR